MDDDAASMTSHLHSRADLTFSTFVRNCVVCESCRKSCVAKLTDRPGILDAALTFHLCEWFDNLSFEVRHIWRYVP